MKSIAAITFALLGGANALTEFAKANIRENMRDDRVLNIAHADVDEVVRRVLHEFGADAFGNHEEEAHYRLSPEAVRALEEQKINFKDTTEDWISSFEANFADENFMCVGEDCAKRDMQSFYSSYQQLPALFDRMDTVANSVSFASIGSIGSSYEGRDQKTINIGDQTKPLVFYFCNIHAREWLTPMYCMNMAEQLVANGGHPLLDYFSFTILVSANPDGYVFSYTSDSMWRKTRKPNSGSSCIGTDPNRNYDNRHCGAGTSNSPCSQIFCGQAPFDQVEVANIRDFALANRNRLIAMNDVHAYSEFWMTPYGGISANPPQPDFNKQMACNKAAVDAIQAENGRSLWAYGPVYDVIYPAAGVSVDWFYDEIGVIYSMSAELRGTSFQPSTGNIMPSNREVFAGMVGSLECVVQQEGLSAGPTPPPVPTTVTTPAPTNFPTPPPTSPPTCFWIFC